MRARFGDWVSALALTAACALLLLSVVVVRCGRVDRATCDILVDQQAGVANLVRCH